MLPIDAMPILSATLHPLENATRKNIVTIAMSRWGILSVGISICVSHDMYSSRV